MELYILVEVCVMMTLYQTCLHILLTPGLLVFSYELTQLMLADVADAGRCSILIAAMQTRHQ